MSFGQLILIILLAAVVAAATAWITSRLLSRSDRDRREPGEMVSIPQATPSAGQAPVLSPAGIPGAPVSGHPHQQPGSPAADGPGWSPRGQASGLPPRLPAWATADFMARISHLRCQLQDRLRHVSLEVLTPLQRCTYQDILVLADSVERSDLSPEERAMALGQAEALVLGFISGLPAGAIAGPAGEYGELPPAGGSAGAPLPAAQRPGPLGEDSLPLPPGGVSGGGTASGIGTETGRKY